MRFTSEAAKPNTLFPFALPRRAPLRSWRDTHGHCPHPNPLHARSPQTMAESHFASLEEQDGVRLIWNVWPSTRLEAAKCVLPLAAVYSPVKALASMPVRVCRERVPEIICTGPCV